MGASEVMHDTISIHVPTRGTTHPFVVVNAADISIHVPTRGTTEFADCISDRVKISIHVPTRGTTLGGMYIIFGGKFQSTCPRGARPTQLPDRSRSFISIHVPTRGTTKFP